MKNVKKIVFIVLLVIMVLSLVACGGGDNGKKNSNSSNSGNTTDNSGRTISSKTPSDIKILTSLEDYGKSTSKYAKSAVDFSGTTYAGKDASAQMEKLTHRITAKKDDVEAGSSTSSFIKIFAMSTAEGLMERMAKAALTFDEMDRVVDYLYGSDYDPDSPTYSLSTYLEKKNGTWGGTFTDGRSEWRNVLDENNEKVFNAGWSFFDDWEMYDRMKDYTEDLTKGDEKDLAGDNASWQYRSILEKVYTKVKLDGDAAARLATYMLDYAVELVENKSHGSAESAISINGDNVTYGPFAQYCKDSWTEGDPFAGLQDYETLSYLLAFNEYYGEEGAGLSDCVKLYGYYYDYNETYYDVVLADEDTYAKQLKYEKQNKFTDEEWLDYVAIQRNNYAKSYRYSEAFYTDFYAVHFQFQGIIEDKDSAVYEMAKIIKKYGLDNPGTTYTAEMKTATTETGSIKGIAGQLALSDWMWCYSESDVCMKEYNQANTEHEDGKASGDSEQENKGKFDFEMQQLYLVDYLLTKMTTVELSGALYYQVYAYSASMVGHMQTDIKNVVYTDDGVEQGAHYTSIDPTAADPNKYAVEKINVIYGQTYASWHTAGIKTLGENAGKQDWKTMDDEIQAAIRYDYTHMTIEKKTEPWKERCERLQDLVVVRIWSCCKQKVHEATNPCQTSHARNADGSKATKDYDTDHTISLFVKNYEDVLYHLAGKTTVSFCTPDEGYKTTDTAIKTTWTAGYNGTIADLRKNSSSAERLMIWNTTNPKKEITISSGKIFAEEIKEADSEDKDWWMLNKTSGNDKTKDSFFDDYYVDEVSGSSSGRYKYSYEFTGWYLDENCRYQFNEKDEIDVNLYIYAGYNVEKSK